MQRPYTNSCVKKKSSLWVVLQIFVGYVVLHANKVYRNIKNRTVCFQDRPLPKSWKQISSIFICPRLCSMQYPSCENPSIHVASGRTQSQPEVHNVNCRFCGAIHNVDRANISVLSQVIHSVNERKTVQTNMISFVSHGDKTLQRLVGMPGEQEYHISSVPFFFS